MTGLEIAAAWTQIIGGVLAVAIAVAALVIAVNQLTKATQAATDTKTAAEDTKTATEATKTATEATKTAAQNTEVAAKNTEIAAKNTEIAAKGQFILGIDDAFRSYEKVRRWINMKPRQRKKAEENGEKPKLSEVYRYIAVFERIGIFIKLGSLLPKEVDPLYGDRFQQLVSYGDGKDFKNDFRTSIYEKFPPRDNPASWSDFIALWSAMADFRPAVGKAPAIPEGETKEAYDEPDDDASTSGASTQPPRPDNLAAMNQLPPTPTSS
jgi:hypothetical protein